MTRKICLIVWLSMLAASPALAQQWARKMFSETSHDFGTIARAAKAEYAFTFENLYLDDVHIASVRSSCGCTKPRIEKQWLKTYEKGKIIAAANSTAFLGNRSATVTVTIDKPYRAQVQLQVKMYVRSDVVLSPGSVQFDSQAKGKSVEKHVQVSYAGRSEWKILDVKSANPHISGRVTEKKRERGRVVYDLAVQLDQDTPAGYIKDCLMLVTNDRRRPQVPVVVEGSVASELSVSPASLFMGVVEPGAKVTKRLVVRGEKPFRILSIKCDEGFFQFGELGDEPKLIHLVPVTFVAGPSGGKVARTIRITTDLGGTTPELAAYAVVSNP